MISKCPLQGREVWDRIMSAMTQPDYCFKCPSIHACDRTYRPITSDHVPLVIVDNCEDRKSYPNLMSCPYTVDCQTEYVYQIVREYLGQGQHANERLFYKCFLDTNEVWFFKYEGDIEYRYSLVYRTLEPYKLTK